MAGAAGIGDDRGVNPGPPIAPPRPPNSAFAGVPVVAGFTLLSRVLGLARDAATAGVFGAGPVLDAFTVAFRLPNLARRLLGEGALSAALLPALVQSKRDEGEAAADALAAAVAGRVAAGWGPRGSRRRRF